VGKLRFATAEIEQRNKYASIDIKEIPFLPNKKQNRIPAQQISLKQTMPYIMSCVIIKY